MTPEPGIESRVAASGDPAQMADIEAEMARILADVFEGAITQEQFEHARSVVGDDYDLIANRDLVNVLLRRVHTGDDNLPTPARLTEELSDLELADVQKLATLLYDPSQHIQIVRILP